jgi:hypothetical protein
MPKNEGAPAPAQQPEDEQQLPEPWAFDNEGVYMDGNLREMDLDHVHLPGGEFDGENYEGFLVTRNRRWSDKEGKEKGWSKVQGINSTGKKVDLGPGSAERFFDSFSSDAKAGLEIEKEPQEGQLVQQGNHIWLRHNNDGEQIRFSANERIPAVTTPEDGKSMIISAKGGARFLFEPASDSDGNPAWKIVQLRAGGANVEHGTVSADSLPPLTIGEQWNVDLPDGSGMYLRKIKRVDIDKGRNIVGDENEQASPRIVDSDPWAYFQATPAPSPDGGTAPDGGGTPDGGTGPDRGGNPRENLHKDEELEKRQKRLDEARGKLAELQAIRSTKGKVSKIREKLLIGRKRAKLEEDYETATKEYNEARDALSSAYIENAIIERIDVPRNNGIDLSDEQKKDIYNDLLLANRWHWGEEAYKLVEARRAVYEDRLKKPLKKTGQWMARQNKWVKMFVPAGAGFVGGLGAKALVGGLAFGVGAPAAAAGGAIFVASRIARRRFITKAENAAKHYAGEQTDMELQDISGVIHRDIRARTNIFPAEPGVDGAAGRPVAQLSEATSSTMGRYNDIEVAKNTKDRRRAVIGALAGVAAAHAVWEGASHLREMWADRPDASLTAPRTWWPSIPEDAESAGLSANGNGAPSPGELDDVVKPVYETPDIEPSEADLEKAISNVVVDVQDGHGTPDMVRDWARDLGVELVDEKKDLATAAAKSLNEQAFSTDGFDSEAIVDFVDKRPKINGREVYDMGNGWAGLQTPGKTVFEPQSVERILRTLEEQGAGDKARAIRAELARRAEEIARDRILEEKNI